MSSLLQLNVPVILPYAADARVDLVPRDLAAKRIWQIVDRPAPAAVSYVNVGLGHQAPLAASLLREVRAASVHAGWRPIACKRSWMLRVSEEADRIADKPQHGALIGVRYLASAAVFESDGIGCSLSLAELLKSLDVAPAQPAPDPSGFYGDWP